MKIYRFFHNGRAAVGVAEGGQIYRHEGPDAFRLGARAEPDRVRPFVANDVVALGDADSRAAVMEEAVDFHVGRWSN